MKNALKAYAKALSRGVKYNSIVFYYGLVVPVDTMLKPVKSIWTLYKSRVYARVTRHRAKKVMKEFDYEQ